MADIPFYTDEIKAPACITDRDRDWASGSQAMATVLHDKFGDGYDDNGEFVGYNEGDPRLLIQDHASETLFIAVHEGKVGILTEVELDIAPADEDTVYSNGTRGMTDKPFSAAVSHWRKALAGLAATFADSEVFLASHSGTYDNRLCLCAFTPLNGQEEVSFSSPYAETDGHNPDGKRTAILEIDTRIGEIAYQTGKAAA